MGAAVSRTNSSGSDDTLTGIKKEIGIRFQGNLRKMMIELEKMQHTK